MLEYPRMDQHTFRQPALGALAFLVIVPNIVAAAPLREEAASYRARGYEAQQRGDNAGALADYQKAAALDPSYPEPLNDAGVVLEEQGRLEDAERWYLKAVSVDAYYLDPHANLGMLYERMGQKSKAIDQWMKRYQLGGSSDPWTIRAKERLTALGALPLPTPPPPPPPPKAAQPARPPAHVVQETKQPNVPTRRHVAEQELQNHAQSLKDYRSVTEAQGEWP